MAQKRTFGATNSDGDALQSIEHIRREERYLNSRIADVDERAESTSSLSARFAYVELGRRYRERLASLSRREATQAAPLHSLS